MLDFEIKVHYSKELAKLSAPRTGDVGFDIHTPDNVVLKGNGITKIYTGIHISLPEGYWSEIRERSSVAGGNIDKGVLGGLIILGGIIDNSYRGELIVAMYNLFPQDQNFKSGDKIAQLIIRKDELHNKEPYMRIVETLEKLGETSRGSGGFGSTGV